MSTACMRVRESVCVCLTGCTESDQDRMTVLFVDKGFELIATLNQHCLVGLDIDSTCCTCCWLKVVDNVR
jgi:hypothetical protein